MALLNYQIIPHAKNIRVFLMVLLRMYLKRKFVENDEKTNE